MPIMPFSGVAKWLRHRKSCASSFAEGSLKDVTLQPCGFTPDMTCRIVPSFPPASMACKMTRRARLLSAKSKYCKASRRWMDLSSLACILASFLYPSVCSGSRSASFTFVSGSTINCLANFMVSRSPQVPDRWLGEPQPTFQWVYMGPYGIVQRDAWEQSQFDL